MQKFQLYLFDFDGTLFDTLPSSKYVFKKAYEKIGIELNEDDILGFTREPIPDSYQRVGGKKEEWSTFINYIEEYVNSKSKNTSILKKVSISLVYTMILMTRLST